MVQKFKKFKIQVQIKSKKLTIYSFLMRKITQFFSINSVKIRPLSSVGEAVYSPDPIQNQHYLS